MLLQRRFIASLALLLTALGSANADPIPVTFDIGPNPTDESDTGFSASWLHTVSGCPGEGPDSGATLFMCGFATPISGTISGWLDAGIFSVDGGTLNIFGGSFAVLSGSLGGAFTDGFGAPLWFLEISGFGTFIFESIDMGDDGPNHFTPREFWLWGQNSDAYRCAGTANFAHFQNDEQCFPWGIDLYGARNSVPEPATFALLCFGLLSLTAVRRLNPRKSRQALS